MTSSVARLYLSDSDSWDSDPDPDSPLPPSPKQPRIEREPEVATLDIADLAKRRGCLSDKEKYDFYCNNLPPDIDFKFPPVKGRKFQHKYLRKYSWLVYSRQENGGYCLPCALFAKSTDVRKGKGALVETAFNTYGKISEVCDNHAERGYHKDAVTDCDAFVALMRGKRESIDIQLRKGARDTIMNNRKKFHSIIETIVLCGRQNIALRGHRDSATDLEGPQSASTNHGNFWALLNFRISAGDTHLRDHLHTASRNAMYTSPVIQNQIINILGDTVRDTILRKVRKSLCYTLIADEVTDSSNKEQLCIVLRYVEPESTFIREDLVAFLECDTGVTGEALAEKMLGFVTTHLDPLKMRGQDYDGGGNMSGKTNGAAARITTVYRLALYTHCASHCLNLAVVASIEEPSVRNMIGILNRVSIFFSAHPKRQKKLEEAIHNTQPESKVVNLKDLCRTRWLERIDAVDRMKRLHSSIVACFETISAEGRHKWSAESVTDVSTLLLAITTTEFITALVITNECLHYLLGLTRSLQQEAKDIVRAMSELTTLTTTLKEVRENVDSYHSEWFEEVSKMCTEVGTTPSMPRICGRHRASTPASSPSEYFRRTISVPILDHLSELDTRFSSHQKTAFQGMYLVPSVLVSKSLATISSQVMEVGVLRC